MSFGNAIYLYVYLYSIYPILFLYLSACHIYQLYHICYLSCFNVIYYLFSVLNFAPNYTTYNTMRYLLLSTINVKGEEKKLNEQTNKQKQKKISSKIIREFKRNLCFALLNFSLVDAEPNLWRRKNRVRFEFHLVAK